MYTIPQTSIQIDPTKIKDVRVELVNDSFRKVYMLIVDMVDSIIECEFTCYTSEYADWLEHAVRNHIE